MSPSIVTVGIEKGGVGKTTTVANLAACFALIGKKVLVTDIDPQANCTELLGIPREQVGDRALAKAILSETSLKTCLMKTNLENVDLLPGSEELKEVINQLGSTFRQDKLLGPVFDAEDLSKYDIVLIDTHGADDCLMTSALAASHYYLIPVNAEQDSARGLIDFLKTGNKVKRYSNPSLTLLGVIITKFDKTNSTHREYDVAIRAEGKNANFTVFETNIPISKSVAAASRNQMTLVEYRKDSPISVAYQTLAGEIRPLLKGRRTGRVPVPNVEVFQESLGALEAIEELAVPENA